MKLLYTLNRKITFVLTALIMLLFANQAKASCNYHAQFTWTASSTNCKTINFTNTSYVTGGNDSGVSYYWKQGATFFSSTKNASYTFSANGTYTVCLIMYKQITGGFCTDTICQTVTVNCNSCSFGSIGWTYSKNCSTRNATFSGYNSDSSGTYKYTWSFGDQSYDTLNHKSTSHTYANNGTYTVCLNIKKYDNGVVCRDTTLCKTITISAVKPSEFTVTPSTSNCKQINLSIQDSNSCAIYYWNWGDNSTSIQTSKTSSMSHTYSGNGTYNICLKTVSCNDSSCYSVKCKYVTINCNTCSIYAYWSFSVACPTRVVTFTTSVSDTARTYYSWSFGDNSSSTDRNPTHTYANNGNYTVCINIKKYTSSLVLCFDTTICKTISVNCTSNCSTYANWSFSVACPSRAVTFASYTGDTAGTWVYGWSFGDSATSSVKNATHTYAGNGTYTVCLRVKRYIGNTTTPCFDTTICKSVTVNCTTSSCSLYGYWGYSVACPTRVVSFSSYVADTSGTYSYSWNFGDNTNLGTTKNLSHTYSSNGTYTVCLTIKRYYNGTTTPCRDTTICKTITVNCSNTSCSLNGNWSYTVSCPSKVTFNGYVADASGTYSYSWNFGDNSSLGTTKEPVHTYANLGTYTVCLTIKRYISGTTTVCKDTVICKTITITAGIHPVNFTAAASSGNCKEIIFNIQDSNSCAKYIWFWGDGTSTVQTSKYSLGHNYANNGTYQVCVKAISCTDSNCYYYKCLSLTVSCNSCSLYTGWSFTVSCPTRTVTFASYVGDTSGYYSYSWNFGDNSSSVSTKNATHTFANNGTYTVCLKVKRFTTPNSTTPCNDTTICKTVTVNCTSNGSCPLYAYWGYSVACPSKIVSFSSYVADTSGTYSYSWNFGDNTNLGTTKNPSHTYSANGTYNVCLTIKRYNSNSTTICRDTTICHTVTVNCTSNNTCSISGYWAFTVACPTRVVSFSTYVADSSGSYSYSWNFGDNTNLGTSKNLSHTYASNGTYTVCLTIKRYNPGTTTVCKDTTMCKTVTVNCTSNTSCSLYGYWGYTIACPSRVVTFYSYVADTSGTYSYTWSFGSTSKNPTKTFTSNGTYSICLTIKRYIPGTTTVCKDTMICKTITINCGCNLAANFNFGVNCALKKLEVGNTTTGDSCYTSKWSFGDGSYSYDKNPAAHTYSQAGTYTVCLVVRKCNDTTCVNYICKTIVIPASCCNSHAYFGTTVICATKKAEVTNYSYGDSCMNYKWSWGDGTYSTLKNPPSHTYSTAGTYTICLKVTKCNDTTCTNTFCKTIVIPSTCCPTPNFYWYNFCNTFRFINTTSGGTSYWWSFGDSSYSSQKSPYHTFYSKRSFQVCLTVFDSTLNCSSTVCKTVVNHCGWFGGGNHFEIPLSDGNIGDAEKMTQENKDLTPSKGLQMNTLAGITVYPNPTNSLLNIVLPASNATIKITDVTGALLMQFDNISSFYKADVSGLAAGVYFVNVINENGLQSVRFMKN